MLCDAIYSSICFICGFKFLFLCCTAGDDNDIIDESMGYFKANVFFKSYEVKVCMCV